ncbi:response regulator [Kovacikia minuta]|uniref:response regulator n=1 Tax=Kovacikia minuta TaxID=2931930 RepID=UPI0020C7D66B
MPQPIPQQTKQKLLIIDDHELVLGGTLSVLKQSYPDAEIQTAQTAQAAPSQIEQMQPDLVVVDLSMPDETGETARTETGIQLLRKLMQHHPTLNIVVQSAHVRALVRLKPAIDDHQGGFTVADKSLRMQDMLKMVDLSLAGQTCTPKEMRKGLEVKPEWLEVLKLASYEELQDNAIAKRMNVSERTVRHYWTKIQDALGVYPDAGKNIPDADRDAGAGRGVD